MHRDFIFEWKCHKAQQDILFLFPSLSGTTKLCFRNVNLRLRCVRNKETLTSRVLPIRLSLPVNPTFDKNLLLGFVAGTCGAMIGAGGGIFLTPLLVSFYGTRQKEAQGTSLVAVSFSTVVASFTYVFGKKVLFLPAFCLMATALFTATWGSRMTSKISSRRLRQYFGLLLIALSLLLPVRQYLSSLYRLSVVSYERMGLKLLPFFFCIGSVAGFLSGLLGIGGGIVLVPILTGFVGIPQHYAQGTSLFGMIVPSILGSITHWNMKNVDRKLLTGVVVGIVMGAFTGSKLALIFPEYYLRLICCCIFFLIGCKFVWTPE